MTPGDTHKHKSYRFPDIICAVIKTTADCLSYMIERTRLPVVEQILFQSKMVNMVLVTSVTGCGMALQERSAIAQIKTVSADTNRLFVQAGNRAALPGNTFYTVVSAMSIRLAPASCSLNVLTPLIIIKHFKEHKGH